MFVLSFALVALWGLTALFLFLIDPFGITAIIEHSTCILLT